MKKVLVMVLACFFAVNLFGCGNRSAEDSHESHPKAKGSVKSSTKGSMSADSEFGRAFDFDIRDINGQSVKLSNYSGKIIILNFFATWCPPCKAEMPDFNEISKEYRDDVEIIAVNVAGEPLSKIKEFVKSLGLTFTIAQDDGTANNLYGPIRAIPVTVVIDRNFNIARKYIGQRRKKIFVQDIKALR